MRRTLGVLVCALCALACRSEQNKSAQENVGAASESVAKDGVVAGDPAHEPGPSDPELDRTNPDHDTVAPGMAAGPGTESGSGPTGTPAHEHEHGPEHGPIPYIPCPVSEDKAQEPEELLNAAANGHQQGNYAVAFSCASAAADLVPRSIDAHHIRAAAAASLGQFDIAQLAFSLALALDPDDPATLAAAAEFYINSMPRRSREPILIGLEYARHGRLQANIRRGVDKQLRAQLTLLQAQAHNDLGKADEAISLVDEALRLIPNWLDAYHERGVALFNLCRFNGARDAFARVIMGQPDDAFAHHHLGLIDEHLGRAARSEHHFRKARSLAPDDFWAPVAISTEEFEREVARAIEELPAELRAMLDAVAVDVVDLPRIDDLTAVEPPFSPTILGLFRGLPLSVDRDAYGDDIPPRAIVLYRKNLARAVHTRAELDAQIRRTLLHEIGHLSGLDEDELRRRGLD